MATYTPDIATAEDTISEMLGLDMPYRKSPRTKRRRRGGDTSDEDARKEALLNLIGKATGSTSEPWNPKTQNVDTDESGLALLIRLLTGR